MRYSLTFNSLPIFPEENYPKNTYLEASAFGLIYKTYHQGEDYAICSWDKISKRVILIDVNYLNEKKPLELPYIIERIDNVDFFKSLSIPDVVQTVTLEYSLCWDPREEKR